MSLIVETGAGLADAESYISAADADTYFALRSVSAWAALTGEQKEAALRKATDYMEQAYADLWKGERTTTTQALSWPRRCVEIRTDEWLAQDIVPAAVSRACAELAVRASSSDLSPDLGAQVQSETVGPISTTYATGARQQTKYQAIDGMLSSLIGGSANTIKLVRG